MQIICATNSDLGPDSITTDRMNRRRWHGAVCIRRATPKPPKTVARKKALNYMFTPSEIEYLE
jgi:hypothetical protein